MTTSIIDRNGNSLVDPALDIPRGAYQQVSSVNKFGAIVEAPLDTDTIVWDGGPTYSWPATALITSVSQTTDQVALRGALVNVQGLDADWNQITQIITLDAADTTTPIVLPTPLIRCFRMILMGDVTTTSTIRAHNAAETVDYAIITAGINQTLMAIYTVPAGYTAYMTSYYTSVTNAVNKIPDNTEVRLKSANRNHGDLFTVKHAFAIPEGMPGFQHQFNPYYKFTEKTDILVEVNCAVQPAHIHAGFDLILINGTREW